MFFLDQNQNIEIQQVINWYHIISMDISSYSVDTPYDYPLVISHSYGTRPTDKWFTENYLQTQVIFQFAIP